MTEMVCVTSGSSYAEGAGVRERGLSHLLSEIRLQNNWCTRDARSSEGQILGVLRVLMDRLDFRKLGGSSGYNKFKRRFFASMLG